MNYKQTVDFLYTKLPMFTRVGASAFKKDLTNTIALCEALGNPQHQFKSIHVGGTNGKGSTSHLLAAVLQAQGYKTGLYTSPHLKDFRERIRINGKMIPKGQVTRFVAKQKSLINAVSPSFFELTVALAFDYFAKEKVDIAVIEVGLGGRLDSTNVIQPLLSVITNISLDHTNMLGNTLAEIAAEKAGIIKKNTPVVIGEKQPESAEIFIRKAKENASPITFASEVLCINQSKLMGNKRKFSVYEHQKCLFSGLQCDLTGIYQSKNILTVLQSLKVLAKNTAFKISDDSIYKGLKQVKKLTGLQGRWQTLQHKPLVICDTGHNEAGIIEVIKNISLTPYRQLHMVFGMVKDKDIRKVLALLPKNASYYFCSPDLERALPAADLLEQAKSYQLSGKSFLSVTAAKKAALAAAQLDDFIFIGGSTFVVAEAI